MEYQTYGSILSDPHADDMGLRFPFLVVEAGGLSLDSILVRAQNQAAISGASMLQILLDVDSQTAATPDADTHTEDSERPSSTPPALCFSIVTEGPLHELWVHFEHDGKFHMEPLRLWQTTLTRDATELVHFLASIMDWGSGAFKDGIVEKLDSIPQHTTFA